MLVFFVIVPLLASMIGANLVFVTANVLHPQTTSVHASGQINAREQRNEFIERFSLISVDEYNNSFTLVPKLVGTSSGPLEEGSGVWYHYVFSRITGAGSGGSGGGVDLGDVCAFMKLWDARNVVGRGYVQYEISRVSWGRMLMYIDGSVVVDMPRVRSGHPAIVPAYSEGSVPPSSTIYAFDPYVGTSVSGSNQFIGRFQIESIDEYQNTFPLVPKFVGASYGPSEEGSWICYYYVFSRASSAGAGSDLGDVGAFMKLWDARNVVGRGYVQYEIARVSWEEMTLSIDNILVVDIPLVSAGHAPIVPAYVEGAIQ